MWRRGALLAVVWALVVGAYLTVAVRQSNELNLSVTAGGQYPYYRNAERIAREGLANFSGDRNRMPLVPAALAIFHTDDFDTFVKRGQRFAIGSSVLLIGLIALACYIALPLWPATFVASLAALQVFLPKAAIVQAELAYYAFFFLTWLLMCRLLVRPTWSSAVLAGVLAALSYYSKASATPLILTFALFMLVRAVTNHVRSEGQRAGRAIGCAGVVVVVFLALASPYLMNNQERFGRYFYNANSTFFMWTDSWSESSRFAKRFDIAEHYPDAPASEIPSPANYVRTHTLGQMASRLTYGFSTLAKMAVAAPYVKYFAAALAIFVVLGARDPTRLKAVRRRYGLSIAFTVFLLIGYGFAYAWFVVVAYGDRFILSLYLPVVFGLIWLSWRIGAKRSVRVATPFVKAHNLLAIVLTTGLIVEAATVAFARELPRDEHFVEFYFNESREAQLDGEIDVAIRGYQGVLTLDPQFAPAHHELAMIALRAGRFDDAVQHASAAVDIRPNDANLLNSYGSALFQKGDVRKAIEILRRAVAADPDFAMTWYNLGGAAHTIGDDETFTEAVAKLTQINPKLASELSELASD